MTAPVLPPPALRAAKAVLVLVEDAALSELIAEALFEAGHVAQMAECDEVLGDEVELEGFDAVIVDLDARSGLWLATVGRIRQVRPALTVIALLPCGADATQFSSLRYHLAIEKPARLGAVIAAVDAAPSM